MTGRLKQRVIDFNLRQHQALVVDEFTEDVTQEIRDTSQRPAGHFHDCACEGCLRHACAQAFLTVVARAAIQHGGGQVPAEHCPDPLCEGCRGFEEAVRDAVSRKIRGSW